LDEVVRIRAIQKFSPSQALAFIFLLKRAIRVEWSGAASGSMAKDRISELEDLDTRIDRTALQAFDVYLGYRKRVYELRVNEVKRSVAGLIERVNSGKGSRPTYEDLVQLTVPECPEVQRGRD